VPLFYKSKPAGQVFMQIELMETQPIPNPVMQTPAKQDKIQNEKSTKEDKSMGKPIESIMISTDCVEYFGKL